MQNSEEDLKSSDGFRAKNKAIEILLSISISLLVFICFVTYYQFFGHSIRNLASAHHHNVIVLDSNFQNYYALFGKFPDSFLDLESDNSSFHFVDPFEDGWSYGKTDAHDGTIRFFGGTLEYYTVSDSRAYIISNGPDRDLDTVGSFDYAEWTSETVHFTYNSSNGTISNGDIWRAIDVE